MTNHDEAEAVRPLTLAWVSRHLEAGERIVGSEALHGGITAEMRRLTIGTRDGGVRHLGLRTFVNVEHAEDWLNGEAGALTLLAGTGVPVPGLAAAASERLYWRVRNGPAFSEDVRSVARAWREGGGRS